MLITRAGELTTRPTLKREDFYMTPVTLEPAAQSLRALIVDDDPRWRAIVAEVLSELGWSITALAAPPDDVLGYQLAVLDIALDPIVARNRDGLALTRQVT